MLEFSIASISVFVGILNKITKTMMDTYSKEKDLSKNIPIFSLIYGLILGLVGYALPDVDMGSNIVEAIFIGLSAGAASTRLVSVSRMTSGSGDSSVTAHSAETRISVAAIASDHRLAAMASDSMRARLFVAVRGFPSSRAFVT